MRHLTLVHKMIVLPTAIPNPPTAQSERLNRQDRHRVSSGPVAAQDRDKNNVLFKRWTKLSIELEHRNRQCRQQSPEMRAEMMNAILDYLGLSSEGITFASPP